MVEVVVEVLSSVLSIALGILVFQVSTVYVSRVADRVFDKRQVAHAQAKKEAGEDGEVDEQIQRKFFRARFWLSFWIRVGYSPGAEIKAAGERVERNLGWMRTEMRKMAPAFCRHSFDWEDRRGPQDGCLLCDGCNRFFPIKGVVVQGWLAERVRLGLPAVDLSEPGDVGGETLPTDIRRGAAAHPL